MNTYCELVNNGLLVNIDVSNINSWDLNTGLTINSVSKWKYAKVGDDNILDYGLTAFDFGYTDRMSNSVNVNNFNDKLTLRRVGYNIINNPDDTIFSGYSSNISYQNYDILPIGSGSTRYFNLDGGYLNGFFKLYEYDYEILPIKFKEGFTIETMLYLNSNSNGIFIYFGVRSEDKYNPYYRDEFISDDTLSGVNTSENNYLNSYTEEYVRKKSFVNPEDSFDIQYVNTLQIDNLKKNAIAFGINDEKKIECKYVDSNGIVNTLESMSRINSTGFTLITITYKPYDITDDYMCIDRYGDLKVYCNGILFWKIIEFPEMNFRELRNDKEKQIGVPFNISWGNGTIGLKNSWHYGYMKYDLIYDKSYEYINNVFIPQNKDGVFDSNCLIDSNDNISISFTGVTSTDISVIHSKEINVISNRDYVFEALVENKSLLYDQYTVSLDVFSTEVDIIIVDSVELTQLDDSNSKLISCKFRVGSNYGEYNVFVGLSIKSTKISNDGKLDIIKFTYSSSDILVEDDSKKGLLLENNFNKPFIGGIQKLRIYDRCLQIDEISQNIFVESRLNKSFKSIKGGRLIYR